MGHTLKFHPAVKKDLKRIDIQARDKIVSEILPILAENPNQGISLVGTLRGFWKYRVFLFGNWYRIVYQIDKANQQIIVVAIGPRGGFYEKLQRRVR